jgi:hypothetical protein
LTKAPSQASVRLPLAAVLLALAILLAGCGAPADDAATTSSSTTTRPPPPRYPLTVRVVQETVDGPPIAQADVWIVDANSSAIGDPASLPPSILTDAAGEAHTVYRSPATVLLQVFGPGDGKGWTREGLRVEVGANVTAPAGWTVENRTLVVPLLRSAFTVQRNASWSTAHATPNPPGNATPASLAVPLSLGLSPALEEAYVARISYVRLTLDWCNTATAYADLAAGLAWGNTTAGVVGEDAVEAPGPFCRSTLYSGPPPAGDRSKGLHVVAVTNRAVVGDIKLAFTAELQFSGVVPEGLAKPPCYPMLPC